MFNATKVQIFLHIRAKICTFALILIKMKKYVTNSSAVKGSSLR